MESTHTYEEPNYMAVFVALIVLTLAELGVAQMTQQLGRSNVVLWLVVLAFTKAGLVALWYMHLKFEGWLLYLVCAVPIVLVAVLVGGTITDVGRPDELVPLFGRPFERTHLTPLQSGAAPATTAAGAPTHGGEAPAATPAEPAAAPSAPEPSAPAAAPSPASATPESAPAAPATTASTASAAPEKSEPASAASSAATTH